MINPYGTMVVDPWSLNKAFLQDHFSEPALEERVEENSDCTKEAYLFWNLMCIDVYVRNHMRIFLLINWNTSWSWQQFRFLSLFARCYLLGSILIRGRTGSAIKFWSSSEQPIPMKTSLYFPKLSLPFIETREHTQPRCWLLRVHISVTFLDQAVTQGWIRVLQQKAFWGGAAYKFWLWFVETARHIVYFVTLWPQVVAIWHRGSGG